VIAYAEALYPETDVLITMDRMLDLSVPLGLLRFLTCPALEELTIDKMSQKPDHLTSFVEFFRRSSPPLPTLRVEKYSYASPLTTVREYLSEVPSLLKLSLFSNRDSQTWLLDILSEKSFIAPNDSTGVFRVLPKLEDLELIFVRAPVAKFADLISARWNAAGMRTLRATRLSRCPDNGHFPHFSAGDDPSSLPAEWDAVKRCIEEGLQFEININ